MNASAIFVETPRLEWHGMRPFAIARLQPQYAQTLEQLALQHEERISNLPVSRGWEQLSDANRTGARYRHYNAFMLDPQMLPLFCALRATHRFLVQSIGDKRRASVLQSWFNVHRAGQRLHRHHHEAHYIGYFVAHGHGSVTRFGPSAVTDDADHPIENQDGLLVVTVGKNHFHEVSHWDNAERARVSYAFDILYPLDAYGQPDPGNPVSGGVLIPFDGPDLL